MFGRLYCEIGGVIKIWMKTGNGLENGLENLPLANLNKRIIIQLHNLREDLFPEFRPNKIHDIEQSPLTGVWSGKSNLFVGFLMPLNMYHSRSQKYNRNSTGEQDPATVNRNLQSHYRTNHL